MEKEKNQFLDIDILNLDKEWLLQPKIFYKYSKQYAMVRKKLEEAKIELEVVRADLDKAVRKNPEKYGISGKPTETAISGAVLLTKTYQEAQQKVIDLKYQADIYSAAVSALIQRKDALENEVRLFGQSYFSIPKADMESKDTVEKMMEENKKKRIQKYGKK